MDNQSPAVINQPKVVSKPSVKELLQKYVIYLPLFVISIVIAIAGAYIYLKYQTPLFSSGISVYFPEDSKGSGGADASVLSEVLLFDKKVNLTNEIQMLRTTSVMSKVVEKLNLNTLYYKKGKTILLELYKSPLIKADILNIKDSSVADRIEIIKEDGKLFRVVNEQKTPIKSNSLIQGNNVLFNVVLDSNSLRENDTYIVHWEPVLNMAHQLLYNLFITQPQADANILAFALNTQDPAKGSDVLNELIVEYNIKSNEQKDKLIDYTLQFIDERVELMRGELGKVEAGLQNLKQAEVITPDAQSGIGLGEYTEAQANIRDAEVRLKMINMVKQSVAGTNQPIPSTLGIDDPILGNLVAEYNQSLFKKEELLRTMPAANPQVKNIQAQMDRLKSNISNNLENIASSTNQMKQRYYGLVQSGRSKLREVPRQERQLLEISRQQTIKEQLFLYLLQRKEEAAITKASNIKTNAIPLDPAYFAGQISPIPKAIYQKAIIFALLIPLAFIYLKELLNDKIITRQDIISKTNTPIIGEIFHNSEKTRKVVVSFNERTVMGEQFRMIRANIPLLTKGQDKKVILFTSTTAGEGKTFCSLNLGAVYAIADKKTVILEMDLRKPKIAHSLNIPNSVKGISHYISGQAALEELPIPIPDVPNLFIVTVGIIPPNPSEMLMDDRIGLLFEYLRANFDFIVIDSAPVGLVSDARILAKYADATMYVVRQRKTVKKQLVSINELYESGIFPNLSLLVNDVKARGTKSYYYGYGSNHMRGYKYSYGAENENKSFLEKAKEKLGKKQSPKI